MFKDLLYPFRKVDYLFLEISKHARYHLLILRYFNCLYLRPCSLPLLLKLLFSYDVISEVLFQLIQLALAIVRAVSSY